MEVKKFDKLLQGQTRSWTLKRCQIRKVRVKIGGVEHPGRPFKMKAVPAPLYQIVTFFRNDKQFL